MIPTALVRRLAAAHWPLAAVCALFLLVGALVLDDYGISPDTKAQRAIGSATLDYLAGDGERAFERLRVSRVRYSPVRYYGAVAEAPLALTERIPGLDDSRDIYLSRHLLTHLFFLVGGVFCYLLVLRLFNSRLLALIAMVLFLLHPRIYAHSFFNSKDAPFLAMFMIALYLVHRAFRRDALAAFILCGVGVGLLVNLRVMGIVLFAAVLALRALDLRGQARKRVLLTGGAFALTALLTYHASLPALWTDPVGRFAELARTFNAHPNEGVNLFRGELLYSPDGPPWDYVPVWVGITTPPATLLLASIGAVALAWRGWRRPRDVLRNGPTRFGFLLAALPVATVAAIVVLESNLYNDWRQLYFVYAPLLLLAAFGLHGMVACASGPWLRTGAYALTGVAVAVTVVSMIRIHPHQSDSFTVLVDRTTPERLVSRWETNYWDQALPSILPDIVGSVPSGTLVLHAWGYHQLLIIPADERRRFINTGEFVPGERSFQDLHGRLCPPRGAHVVRLYANTLSCVVNTATYFGGLRRAALAAEPLVRSVYDVYRDGRLLTYVRDECPHEDVAEGWPRFFLHVIPVDAGDIPHWRREHGFDNFDTFLQHHVARLEGNCVAVVRLPDYPLVAVRTGQFASEGVLWEADIAFGEEVPHYAAARRDALAGEPMARSVYDVHLAGRTLTYLRDGCTDAERDALFFLHVVPVDEGDLPEHRREYGFDNLDFTLETHGARPDGNCVALARLPDYPIATIRTGQYDGTGALWTAEFTLPDGE